MPMQSAAQVSPQPLVMVGVDGSPSSLGALRWALSAATRSEATVRAVFVFPWTDPLAAHGRPDTSSAADDLSFIQLAGDELTRAIRRSLGDEAVQQVTTVVIPADSTSSGLCDAAAHADLLVVGAGRNPDQEGGIGTKMIGALHNLRCPVVIVPARESADLAA